MPFSSRRRWSALEIGGRAAGARGARGAARPRGRHRRGRQSAARPRPRRGRRRAPRPRARRPTPIRSPSPGPDVELTSDPEALGIVILAEDLRESASDTVAFFAREGVALKVLSGDNPATVGAIARDLGIEAEADALDGTKLPEDDAELLAAVRAAPAIGRISPEDKARVVRVLKEGGEYVAMLGDGVNDVPALKEARLAIAQGSGTQMARSVADLVLVSGEFGEVPPMVDQGRQILRNIQRVARLFVSKAVAVAFLVLVVGIPSAVFPMLPRQFTLTTTFTIGIPAFFLALAPSSGPWRPEGFLQGARALRDPGRDRHRASACSPATSPPATSSTSSLTEARTRHRRHLGRRRPRDRLRARGRAGQAARGGRRPRARRWRRSSSAPARSPPRAASSASPPPNGDMAAAWAIGSVLSVLLLVVAIGIYRRLEGGQGPRGHPAETPALRSR